MTKRENILLAYQHKEPEFMPLMFTDVSVFSALPDLERYSGSESGKDYFGVDWTFEPAVGAPMPTPGMELFDDILDWREKMIIPDLDKIYWVKQAEIDTHTNFLKLLSGQKLQDCYMEESIYEKDTIKVCMILNGMFERLHACMGFENALMAVVSEPEECYEFFGAIADHKIKYFEKIGKYYNVDVIMSHDDYGSCDRLFMSPETWRKLLKPHLARMVKACHDAGMLYEHHSCGYIEPIFEDLVEIGVDAINPLQSGNKNLLELKKKFGDKITFCGGFDNQGILEVPGVSEEAIRNEYRRVIDLLAPGGSYVVAPPILKMDFVPHFMDEHIKYGVNFYKKN